MRILLLMLAGLCMGAADDDSWKQPLDEKEKILERNIVERHNILGLYPSQVEVPLDGRPVDNTTLGIGNIAHSVCWTSNYLAGASYRYAFLKKSGAPAEEVEAARRRADELFEAVYRCQLVTGVRGLQARGYALGHGESYEERWGDPTKDEWHQGAGEYSDLRWRGDPSHHNYSDAIHGLGQYYDLAAEGPQKDRCREAIDALVSYWLDNDYQIRDYEDDGRPVPILGLTDGKTLNTRIMMAIAGLKVAHHATGHDKYRKAYDQLVAQYGVRGLEEFRTSKDFDDAEHVFCHLENLFRLETDPELLAGYRAVLDGLWANHKNDAQTLFTYIYAALTPEFPDREKALREALYSLQTWPTDMTLRPRMNSLHPDRKPPYPMHQAAWDNEYIWKGSLLQADGWLARTVLGVAVPAEDPVVLYAFDERGDLYQSRDGGATAAGWRPIDDKLPSPVRALAVAHKVRILAVACDDGFYKSTTAGYRWERLPIPGEGRPRDIRFDPENPFVLYAATDRGVYRSRDFGEEFLGESWDELTGNLPPVDDASFVTALAPGHPGRIYAVLDGNLFTRRLDEEAWQPGGVRGFGRYARNYPWIVPDPSNPDRAFSGVMSDYGSLGLHTLLQETRDGGLTWSNSLKSIYDLYAKGGTKALIEAMVPGEIAPPAIDPKNPQTLYSGGLRGVLKSTDGGVTWQEKKTGLDIPVGRALMAPANTDWVFAGTPAGLFVSRDFGETWESAHLVPQFEKNTRREIGGAAYIDAYWRGRYYGFIDDETARRPYDERRASRSTP